MYVVGDVGIQEELDLKGIKHIGGPADKDQVVELKPGYALPHDHDVCLTQYRQTLIEFHQCNNSIDDLHSPYCFLRQAWRLTFLLYSHS